MMTFNGSTAALITMGWIGWFLGGSDWSLGFVGFIIFLLAMIITPMLKEENE